MEERTCGIILRTRPLTETSLVVQWLTPDLGRIFTVAKGARRPKSPFLGKLDLFYEADFSFARSRRSDLHNLREVSVRNLNAALRQEMERLSQASYFAVLLEKSTEPESPILELHELLKQALAHFTNHPASPEVVFVFELKLLCALGYEPELTAIRAGARKHAEAALNHSFEDSIRDLSQIETAAKQELNQLLQRAIGVALERIPAQRAGALVL